jgi:EAL domain-containing protein (putative c-di-GMP-specific phosphodiesterase class I)/ActR/RegA family two-component response regulator
MMKGMLGRVLVVDDDASLRRAVRRQLEAEGWTVVDVEGGPAAIAEVTGKHELFDCVVSDVQMPDLTGFELIAAIRQHDHDLPILLMTGDPSLDGAVKAIDSGAVSYLTKPFDQETLNSAVARASRLHGVARMRRRAELQGQGPDVSELEPRFQRALEQAWMAFQPIVDVPRQTVFAYEALLRTDEETLKRPDVFISAAERLGRIHDLGRVVRAAVARRAPAAPPGVLLFVNVHGLELTDEALYLPTAPLAALSSRVVLEITERIGLDAVGGEARVAQLRKLGFKIAVDDLGAGYAALGALASLEPEIVKLDMSLVRDLERHLTKRRVVGAMATLVRELGGRVVAEGVETIEERDAVLECGVELMQGYLFARPAREFVRPVF